jgi:uncharacterized protein YbjT (DUF2867 family)
MVQPLILVTGATGKTGAAVVNRLLEQEVPVRALVHRRDARSAGFERRGVEVVAADMFDPDQLLDALRGVQRAYYLPFFHTHMIQSTVAFALAARQARLEAIVHMGQCAYSDDAARVFQPSSARRSNLMAPTIPS